MGFVKKAFKGVTKLVSGLFSAPKVPKAPPPIQTPTMEDRAGIAAAADAARRRERVASGRAATMLSDQSNYTDPTIGRKKLG